MMVAFFVYILIEIPDELHTPMESPRPFLKDDKGYYEPHTEEAGFRIELQPATEENDDHLFAKRKPADKVNFEEIIPQHNYSGVMTQNEGFEEFKYAFVSG